ARYSELLHLLDFGQHFRQMTRCQNSFHPTSENEATWTQNHRVRDFPENVICRPLLVAGKQIGDFHVDAWLLARHPGKQVGDFWRATNQNLIVEFYLEALTN